MSWQARINESLGYLPRTYQLIRQASPRGTAAILILAVVVGLVPPAIAWTKKLLIDGIVGFVADGTSPNEGLIILIPLLILVFCIQSIFNAGTQGRNLVEHHLRARVTLHINKLIMDKAQSLDLEQFEDPQFYDKLQNAQTDADQRIITVVSLSIDLLRAGLTFLSFIAILVTFSPWLVLLFFFATVPSFALQNHYGKANFRLLSGQAPERRRLLYLKELLTTDRYKKESRLLGIGGRFLRQYVEEFWPLFREDMAIARKRSVISLLWGTIAVALYLGVICWIIYSAIAQTITFGEAVLYFEVFEQSHYLSQTMLRLSLQLVQHNLFVKNLFIFLAINPTMPLSEQPRSAPPGSHIHIDFQDVSFRYPNQSDWTLRHINLRIKPGEKLALVGLNGAGKTTIIKLLTRLYDPSEGRITVNGIPLTEIDRDEWHSKIGVIFQDFVQYQLTAKENVGLGRVEALHDRAQIIAAAQKGGAHNTLSNLQYGYDTVLGRRFEGGQELSLGQWQKVALSRAFMRDADILILDEPTAALDAEQEYHIFQNFRRLTENKTAILISHRFSTVRMAERIAVIDDGRIVEIGSHADLIQRDGVYAHLFSIQAEGYAL